MKHRRTIGLLIDQLVSGYARLLIDGVTEGCRLQQASLVVFSGRVLESPLGFEYQNNVIFDSISSSVIDALVVAAGTQGTYLPPEELRARLRRFEGIPLVSIGARFPGIPCVLTENRTGILQSVAHLVEEHGIRRIAFLRGPRSNQEAEARFAAYREAVRAHGVDDEPSLWLQGDFTAPSALKALADAQGGRARPDFQALVAANDAMAVAAMQWLNDRGLEVPRDIAVTGFDDIPESQFLSPSLTTVCHHVHDIGSTAAAMAVRLAAGETLPDETVLPAELVLRTSCGCLPRSVVALGGLPTSQAGGGGRGGNGTAVDRCLARLPQPLPAFTGRSARGLLVTLVEAAAGDRFLRVLQRELSAAAADRRPLLPWRDLLAALEESLLEDAASLEETFRLRSLFQQAAVLLSESLRSEQGMRVIELQGQLAQLRRAMEGLISSESSEELMNHVAAELDRLDIRTCVVVSYPEERRHRRGESWEVPASARIMLARKDGVRITLAPPGDVFAPADGFLPARLLPEGRPFVLVATAAFFREDQLGYIAFEPGRRDNAIYETFSVQLSSLLKGSRMFDTMTRVAALVESSQEAIFGVDVHGRVATWNGAASAAFGYAHGEIEGTPVSVLLAEEPSESQAPAWEDAAAGMVVPPFEALGRRKDGSVLPLTIALSPIREPRGAVVGLAVTARDMTRENAIQARLIQAQRLESLGTLAAGVAHQFNNINMVIKGYLDALVATDGLPPSAASFAKEALRGVDRLVDITERMQGLTGAPEGGQDTCRLSELVRTQLSRFEARVADLGAALSLELPRTPPVRMHAARAGFLLSALLGNALDSLAGLPARSITLRTGVDAAGVFLDVRDTGCGIRPSDLPKLFTPFYSTKGEWAGPGSPQSALRGIGLSLSICRSIVSESGGRIEVESEPGAGTTIHVWLPAAEEQAERGDDGLFERPG